jgi:hypothetical protein
MPCSHQPDIAFIRLHALVGKGYRADLGAKNDTILIRLEHPRGASAGAPSLLLCSDGRIMATDNIRPLNTGEGDPDCIYVESEADRRLFQSFLATVPKPTTWQGLDAMTMWEVRMFVVLGVILCSVALGVTLLVLWVWPHSLR